MFMIHVVAESSRSLATSAQIIPALRHRRKFRRAVCPGRGIATQPAPTRNPQISMSVAH
jgi:hypothetical protein